MMLLSVAGIFILIRKNSLFSLYPLVLVWLQIIGFLIAGPVRSPVSILLNRYAIAVLPFFFWPGLGGNAPRPENRDKVGKRHN